MKKISIIFAALFVLATLGHRAQAQCAGGADCSITITGHDAYSDGWNGNTITIIQADSTLGTFTLSGGSDYTQTFPVCTADGPVTLSWTTGSYPEEVSFTVVDAMGVMLYNCTDGSTLYYGTFAIVNPCPTCPGVTGLSVVPGPTTATASWSEIGLATQWYYSYNTEPVPSDTWTYTSDTTATVSGLTPNTDYYFFVRSYCGGTDTSVALMSSFRTECAGITLPYTEGFEGYSYGTLAPDCWKIWESASSYGSTYPSVYTYDGYNGNNSYYFYPVYGNQSVVSPKIPIPANTLEVQMWIQASDQVEVGYITTSDFNNAVFHQVGTAGPTALGADGYSHLWEQVSIPFDTVTTTDSIWVVFRTAATFEYNTVYIDDVVFREINNCPMPTALTATSTESHQVTLNWTCPDGTQWEVYHGPQGFDPDTATPVVVNTPTYTFTDLDNSVIYDFYVRTLCGTQASYWPLPVSAMPYAYVVTAAVDSTSFCDRTIVDNGGATGDFSANTEQLIVLRAPDADQTVRIYGKAILGNGATYSGDENKLRIFDGADTNGQLLVSVYNSDVYDINVMGETGALTIWFKGANYSYYLDEGFQFYVTCVDRPDCLSPYGLTVSNVAGSTAQVNWEYNTVMGEAEGFSLILTDEDGVEQVIDLSGSARSYLLTGLNQRTRYTVGVAVDCAGTDTVRASFLTLCNNGGELQIGEGTNTINAIPTNIYYGNSLTQQIFKAAELNGNPAVFGVQFNQTSTTSADRQIEVYMDTTSLSSYASSSDYVVPSHRYFNGTVHFENGWVNINFDSAFTVPANKNVVLTVNDYTGAWVSTTNFEATEDTAVMAMYTYIDGTPYDPTNNSYSFTMSSLRSNVRFLVACSESNCVPPVLDQMVIGQTEVDLSWLPGGNEASWRVEYRQVDSTNWIVANANITTTNYTLTGLTGATSYRIRIISQCSADDESILNLSVTTKCAPETVPFSENFEAFNAGSAVGDPIQMCWNRGSIYTSMSYPYQYPWVGFNSASSMYFAGYNSYLVLPEFDVSVDSLNVAFYATMDNASYYESETIEVGVCTDPNDLSTFVVVASQTIPSNSSDWHLVDVDLENYTGPNGRIFIRNTTSDYTIVYVDSLSVSLLPDCRRVNNVTLASVASDSAVLAITDNHNYGSYEVLYNTINDQSTATAMTVSGTTVTLNGLVDNTPYYVWVRSNCSVSHQSKPFFLTFRTECNSPYVISEDNIYNQEFESGLLDCMMQPDDNTAMWTNEVSNYNAHAFSGGRMAAINSGDATAEGLLVLPTYDFSQLSENAHLNFYRYLYTSTYGTYPADKLAVLYRVGTTGAWNTLMVVDSTKNTWQNIRCVLPSSAGAPLYQVALKAYDMNYDAAVYIDNVVVKPAPTCAMPENVAVSNVTERRATISWTGNSSTYKVQYRPVGTISWNARTVEGVDSVVITPLAMAKDYQVRVTGVCSPYNQSDPSDILTFTTDFCEDRTENSNYAAADPTAVSAVAPFNAVKYCSYAEVLIDSAALAGMDNLEGLTFSVNTVGAGAQMTQGEIFIGHTNATSMSGFLYDTSFVSVFSGDISFNTTGSRRVLFNEPFVWDGHRNLVVGFYYSASNGTPSDSVKYNAHQAGSNKLYYGGSTTHFTPDQANMLSAANRAASSIVPDITFIACNPVCYEPVVSRVNTTDHSVEVTWYNEGADVQIAIKAASETNWETAVLVEDTNSYTFDLLPSMTDFDIRLRRDCSNDGLDYSDWVYLTATTDTACSIPEGLVVTDVTANTATFSWNDGPMVGGKWELHVWNNNINRYYTVTTNPATVSDLDPSSSYHAAVRAYCGTSDHVVGEWSDEMTFDNVCYPVTNLQAQVNGTDVVLTWNAGNRNQRWMVVYGYQGFELNDQLGYMIVNTPTATISGLASVSMFKGTTAGTFGFRVRAICDEGWNSTWSNESQIRFQSIDDVEGTDAQVALRPNPATDLVSLHITGLEGSAMVTVLSVDGRQLRQAETAESDLDIDVSMLASGTYFVRVQTAGWTAVRKLIVR